MQVIKEQTRPEPGWELFWFYCIGGVKRQLGAAGVAGEFGVELGFGFGTFFGGIAAGHDGGAEAGGEVFGELVGLFVPVDVDGLPGGVHDYLAVMAGAEVLFDFVEQIGVNLSVEVVG